MSDAGPGETDDPSRPDVTVVIRVHNDAYVTEAVRSVLTQTLRTIELVVVDHGSTDGTGATVDKLASSDPRMRVIHLPAGGGPGRPGNVGIDAAAGRYLTFLDSDDVLEPDACRRLLGAAEAFDADLVCSLVHRVLVDDGKRLSRWYPKLYEQRQVLEGIREKPDQLWDQLPVAKLYRTQWMRDREIRFLDEGVYEDQYLCVAAYVRAARIAVIPDSTYRWYVRQKDTRTSITQSRSNVQNLLDRITSNERIDELLAKEDAADLRPEKDAKFLRHDLAIHVRELWQRDREFQKTFLDRVGGYVEGLDAEFLEAQPSPTRALIWFLRRRDLEGVISVASYLSSPGRVTSDLACRDGRTYWTSRYLDDEEGRRWLDVTDLKLDRVPASSRHLTNELRVLGSTDGVLHVEGEIRNLLGTVPQDADVRVRVRVQPRRGGRAVHFAAKDVVNDGEFLRFTADLDLAGRLPIGLRRTQAWNVYAEVRWDGLSNVTRTSVIEPDIVGVTVPVSPRLAAVVGNAVRFEASRRAGLRLVLVNSNVRAVRLGNATIRAARTARAGKALRWGRRTVQERVKPAYFTLCKALPPQRDTVLFESFQGRQYSDSPKVVYEALRAKHPELKTVWSYAPSRGRSGFPKDSALVPRESWAYYRTLARAGYWVDNYGFPKPCRPRRATTYVQTWHGTPFKMVMFDLDRIHQLPARRRQFWQGFVDRWDWVVVPNEYYRGTFIRASNTAGQEIRAGLPRNDVLVTRSSAADAEAVKRQLGLPLDRRIVLYTPTWRRAAAGVPLTLPDLDEMAEALGDEYYLLVRQHYYRRGVKVPQSLAWFARDVSGLDETSTLLLASDILVTDFSSVAFDFAFLRRPMIFYVPDYDFYTRVEPRTYIDLAEVAPGPLVSDTQGLVAAIRRSDEDRATYAEAYEKFFTRYCAADNGRAGDIVVERVWGPGTTP